MMRETKAAQLLTSNPMNCPERSSLRRKHQLYARAYSDAIKQLSMVSSEAAKSDWDSALDLARRAERMCEDVRVQLLKHGEEHGC
jgi:hypothetical protein